jgi:NAD(P)-dependent dehydrogenase (short-subunit alcohol dehydrogenase family)
MRYADKVVLVTGGSQGIGEGCVRVFADAGANVTFCARREAEGVALAREVSARHPGRVHFVQCDVAQEDATRALVGGVVSRWGRIDCLVNNAGWHPPHKPIDDFTAQEFRDLLELNLVSMFVACQAALPSLRVAKGNIVNMSSLVGSMGQLHATTYVATKGAITAFTKALAVDEAVHGVRVNSVSPGNVWTPLWKQAVDASPNPAKTREDGDAAQLLGRMGTLEEAGRLCLFIAAEATFTTGVDHILSGGAELSYGRKSRT